MNRGRGLLLRAELRGRDLRAPLVLEADGKARLVVDADGEIGARCQLALGWPPLVPVELVDATVVGVDRAGDPGDRAQWHLELDPGPALARLAQAVAGAAGEPRPGAQARLLLVEDSDLLRDVFRAASRRHFGAAAGAVVIDAAADVEAAWGLAAAHAYDLIVVDYLLPEPAGHRLIARLREAGQVAVPVVAVSLGGESARAATLAAGADLFLAKPLALAELFSTIDLCLAKGGPACPSAS